MNQLKFLLLLVCLLVFSFLPRRPNDSLLYVRDQNSQMLIDWINLQLKLVRNTKGIQHVAYSRHFAYSGIVFYEALVNGDKRFVSIAPQVNGGLKLPLVPKGKTIYWPVVANAAVSEVLRYFYSETVVNLSAIDSLEKAYYRKFLLLVKNAGDVELSVKYGKKLALSVIDWSQTDYASDAAVSYELRGEGFWVPAADAPAPPAVPKWGDNRTILAGSTTNALSPPPPAFSKIRGSLFYNKMKEVYDVSNALTPNQVAAANFWDDSPNGKNLTVFGHWSNILKQVLEKEQPSLIRGAEAYLRLVITMYESAIVCWKTKYTYNQIRPVTYIRKYLGDSNWSPLIKTPPHPEYCAAHASISSAAAFVMESEFGKNYAFIDHSYDILGMLPRAFGSFEEAGREAGLSRLYGGIHYRPSIEAGYRQGKKVGENVLAVMKILRSDKSK